MARQDLKQYEFIEKVGGFISWVRHNRKRLWNIIFFVGLAAVFTVYYFTGKRKERLLQKYAFDSAFYMESIAYGSSDNRALEKVFEGYNKIIKNYPDSDAAIRAYYHIGNIYLNYGKFDEAIASYESVIEKKDHELVPLAVYAKGFALEELASFKEQEMQRTNTISKADIENYIKSAVATYSILTNYKDSFIYPKGMRNLARCYMMLKKKGDAIRVLKETYKYLKGKYEDYALVKIKEDINYYEAY